LRRCGESRTQRRGGLVSTSSIGRKREGETSSIRLHDLQLDYRRAQYGKTPADREGLDLIRGAVRLSSHVIHRDPREFASQMVGRLLPYQQFEVPLFSDR
jgi:hypothetical protein